MLCVFVCMPMWACMGRPELDLSPWRAQPFLLPVFYCSPILHPTCSPPGPPMMLPPPHHPPNFHEQQQYRRRDHPEGGPQQGHMTRQPRPFRWDLFMTDREKDRFIEIQLFQLQCKAPFREDYYYQVGSVWLPGGECVATRWGVGVLATKCCLLACGGNCFRVACIANCMHSSCTNT